MPAKPLHNATKPSAACCHNVYGTCRLGNRPLKQLKRRLPPWGHQLLDHPLPDYGPQALLLLGCRPPQLPGRRLPFRPCTVARTSVGAAVRYAVRTAEPMLPQAQATCPGEYAELELTAAAAATRPA